MSVTIVQPYCECKSQNCLLRNLDSDGVCAITLDLSDEQWAALLKKYNNAIYVTSADCGMSIDPSFILIEKSGSYLIYGQMVADAAPL
jgi:hypothetical protein